MAECYGCQIKLNKTKEDVARCRTLVAGKKLTGISGTGTVRIYNTTSRLIQADPELGPCVLSVRGPRDPAGGLLPAEPGRKGPDLGLRLL